MTVKDIAKKLDVAKSRISKLINNLHKKGFIDRIDDPKDSRVRLISLSSEGIRKSEEIESFHQAIHRQILLQFNQKERQKVISNLETLRSAMEIVKDQLK